MLNEGSPSHNSTPKKNCPLIVRVEKLPKQLKVGSFIEIR
jgi:hypothetical protein